MLFLKYLKKIIMLDKAFFFFVIIFVLGQGFFTYKGVETFPFFNFGMYSSKFSKPECLEVLQLSINNKRVIVNNSNYKSKSFIYKQLNYYFYSNIANSEIDFGKWLKKYLQKSTSTEITKIDLIVCKFSSNSPYQLIKEDTYPLYDKQQ